MMFLKYRYRLSCELVCQEAADSLSWRRFCRIPLGRPTPHPTTLMKITTRCGQATIDALNEALLAKAHAAKVVKLDKARADTTVVEANVAYPTDSGVAGQGGRQVEPAGRAYPCRRRRQAHPDAGPASGGRTPSAGDRVEVEAA
jgi:transposase, IS5 family